MATQFLSPTTAPPFTRVTAPEERVEMMESFGFLAFGFYFFLVFSRMPELIALRFGHSFYQIFISSVLCMVMMVVNGGLSRVVGSKMSILLIVLHVWYVASFPFSYWRTGTLEALSAIMKVLPLAFFAMALVRTEKQLRSTFTIMRAAMLVTLIFTMTAPVSENSDNRLQLDGGRFANSNEIAVYLLLGLPFWLHMATTKRFPMVLRPKPIFDRTTGELITLLRANLSIAKSRCLAVSFPIARARLSRLSHCAPGSRAFAGM